MAKKILLATLILLIGCATVTAKPLTLYEIQEATCQVFAKNSMGKTIQGTATCVALNVGDNQVAFMTNGHVVGQSKNVTIHYFRSGYRSNPIPATVLWKVYQNRTVKDIAVIVAEKRYFDKYLPRKIPIAPRGYKVGPKNFVYAAGCQFKQWPMSWIGHAQDVQHWIEFQPAPTAGQSGSALLCLIKIKGEWQTFVCGLVTWTDGDSAEGRGGAVPISVYHQYVDYKNTRVLPNSLNKRVPVSFEEIPEGYRHNGIDRLYKRATYTIPPVDNNPKYAVTVIEDGEIQIDSQFCGPDGCSPQSSQQIWPFGNGRILPQRPQQPILPQDRPRILPQQPQPQTQPEQLPLPNQPFNNEIPDIGGIWSDSEQPQEKPEVEQQEEYNSPAVDLSNINTEPRSWFQYLRQNGYGWLQALGLAGIIGFGSILWKMFKPRLTTSIDNIQDSWQKAAEAKFGKDVAEDLREILENVETLFVETVDELTESKRQAKERVIGSKLGKLREIVRENRKEDDVESIIKNAGDDPNEKDISPKVADKLINIVREIKKEK